MKKVYSMPRLDVVKLPSTDIICTSTQNGGTLQGREGWWDDEEDW